MYAELKRKICTKCKVEKYLTEFHKRISLNTHRPECKKCAADSYSKYRKTPQGQKVVKKAIAKFFGNKDKVKRYKEQQRDATRFRKYGITRELFDKMLKDQDYKCAITSCDVKHEKLKNGLIVEHCHTTGKIRGLTCNYCNNAIGFLREQKQIALDIITYLEKFKK